MGAVKNFYHDEIANYCSECGRPMRDPEQIRLEAAGKIVANRRTPGKTGLRHAIEIMEGKWDKSPAVKLEVARLWMEEEQ